MIFSSTTCRHRSLSRSQSQAIYESVSKMSQQPSITPFPCNAIQAELHNSHFFSFMRVKIHATNTKHSETSLMLAKKKMHIMSSKMRNKDMEQTPTMPFPSPWLWVPRTDTGRINSLQFTWFHNVCQTNRLTPA